MTNLILVLFGLVPLVVCKERNGIRQQPLVAFKCNKPSMYLGPNGWIADRAMDCIEEPDEILTYCKKAYPSKVISNIVEATETIKISSWCNFDEQNCEEHEIRPFRCLEGIFQSDALLVPQHCLFDHKHGTQCSRWMSWNTTAQSACRERFMELDSFAVLQPCGTAVFTGVEFVCCPHGDASHSFPTGNYVPVIDEKNVAVDPEPIDNDIIEDKYSKKKDLQMQDNADDFFKNYIEDPVEENSNNEHQRFLKAKNNLVKHHHDKVTKMMKDWAEAREQVQKLRHVDPKAAEKLHQEISQRFQKTYEALEQEGQMEKQQVVTVHQQRVQAKLNQRKHDTMEAYIEVLTGDKPSAGHIVKKLIQYLKAEEKDRLHSVNHFYHVQENDEGEAVAVARAQTLQHIDVIDERMKQAVTMLDRVPDLKDKVHSRVVEYLGTFNELDHEVKAIREMPDEPIQPVYEPQQTAKLVPLTDLAIEDVKELPKGKPLPKENSFVEETLVKKTDYDDEIDEDEHEQPLLEVQPADHLEDGRMQLKIVEYPLASKSDRSSRLGYSSGTTVALAIAAVAVFVIMLVGVLLLRRRASNQHQLTAVEVAASPEERHVANMQMNGYENPTYRYFEMSAQA